MLTKFLIDDDGATLIEYALIAALISVVAIAALTTVGSEVNTTFEGIATTLTGAGGGGVAPPPAP